MSKLLALYLLTLAVNLQAQERIFPAIKLAGGIFEVPDAQEKPDPSLVYNIVIELVAASENPAQLNQALNNVARLYNLHVLGGVPKKNLHIVVAIHGEAAYTITNSKTYEAKYQAPNLNIEAYQELAKAGVKFFVCGQSLVARNIARETIIPEIDIATSMLTTVTTYQLKGYAYLKF